jgi:hypothetical protein
MCGGASLLVREGLLVWLVRVALPTGSTSAVA